MEIRPYALLKSSLLRQLEQRFDATLSTWRAAWGITSSDGTAVSCTRSWDAPQREEKWKAHFLSDSKTGSAKSIWLGHPDDFAKSLQRQMFPSDGRQVALPDGRISLASDGGATAARALQDAIAAECGFMAVHATDEKNARPPAELFQHASGAVLISLKAGEQVLKVLLNHAAVESLLGARETVLLDRLHKVDLANALQHSAVSLKVGLGQVEVPVGQLLTLAAGDVIRLSAPIEKPLPVAGPDGQVLFGAHLGMSGGAKAIEAVPYSK